MARPHQVHGFLPEADGHHVYWEQAGAPKGIAALVLHGGPGSGCRDGHYDLFDLEDYRVALMDQRGCGRSRPLAADTLAGLAHNTTDDLIADILRLKAQLGVDKWVVFGGSWGSTLALHYAQEHPEHILHLVLAGVATTTSRDLAWLYEDMGNLFPEAYDDFAALVPEAAEASGRIAGYAELLREDADVQAAADAWCQWELAIFDQDFEGVGAPWTDPAFRRGFARIVTHYFANLAWRPDGHLMGHMDRISDLPGVMIHSRFDRSCPLRPPWELSKRWPAATLEILGGHDHSALSSVMQQHIRAATDGIAAGF